MKTINALNQSNLPLIDAGLGKPNYDRSQVRSGIAHIGVGGFHRSHEAYFIDALLEKPDTNHWGICGIGLREADKKIAEVLEQQNHLYTLIVKHPDNKIESRIIGSLTGFILGTEHPQQVIEQLANPDIKIVSLTITEGGYNMSPSGEFDFEHPEVIHDLASPEHPQSVFGFLTAALRQRRNLELPAFTVLSCDNVEHNGEVARSALLAFAEKQDALLAEWIAEEVCFPNSMVDRITPVTTKSDLEYLESTFHLTDEWPVTCEPFTQWVIEDNFSTERPPLEEVGVQFVEDVSPYEKMKLRLLNAGHSLLGILGSIHGHQTIVGCMKDPIFERFLRMFMDMEATPVLDAVAGIDLDQYKDSLIERFGNPNIKDSLVRICSESAAKLPKFLIPTISENLDRKGSFEYATLVVAAWCYYSDKGLNNKGEPIEIIDAMGRQLHEAARGTQEDLLSFLRIETVFGDLIENEPFTKLYSEMVQRIYEDPRIIRYMKK